MMTIRFQTWEGSHYRSGQWEEEREGGSGEREQCCGGGEC